MRKIKISALDGLFSKIIRRKAKWTCERCGTKHKENSFGLHLSHFIGRANMSTRWYPDNCDVFCYGCHQWMETRKPTEYALWKLKKLGTEKYNALINLSRKIKQWSVQEKEGMKNGFKRAIG